MQHAAINIANIATLNGGLTELFSRYTSSQLFILVDENTLEHCYPVVKNVLPTHSVIQIPAGEANKALTTCELVWQQLTAQNADRNSLLINLGGGVIGDLGGFAAGCYKRGIRFINLPTTLLAMVDASVGAKTGIDFNGLKNQLGLFNEPAAVFIYTGFLKTLPGRQLVSGFAEIIKHYLIADKNAFNQLPGSLPALSTLNFDALVAHSVQIKSAIVTQDPLEQGNRKSLNFGHTVGHAIESHFLLKPGQELLHGEAVAIGIICESFISEKRGLINAAELVEITKLVFNYFKLPSLNQNEFVTLLELMKQDKKNTANRNRFTLLQGIGNYCIDNYVEEEIIIQSLQYYNHALV